MPDIALRFHKDMLVLSTPIREAMERMGIQTTRDSELTLLIEPEILEEHYHLESLMGTQCFVAPTANLTPSMLRRTGMQDKAQDLADKALELVKGLNPQHVLVEIGPCELPIDPSSQSSMKEIRNQYERAAKLFVGKEFDAFFLNGFYNLADLKCALAGVAKYASVPVFAAVDVTIDGTLGDGRGTIEEACQAIEEFEGAVVGFSTYGDAEVAWKLANRVNQVTTLPLLIELGVRKREPLPSVPESENPYYQADKMVDAFDTLRDTGVQFLRAVGDATPAYSGALVAATSGLDAVETQKLEAVQQKIEIEEMDDFIASARKKVSDALKGVFDSPAAAFDPYADPDYDETQD